MNPFKLRIRYKHKGGHVHCRVFVGRSSPGATLTKAGELILTESEFVSWMESGMVMEFEQDGDQGAYRRYLAIKENG